VGVVCLAPGQGLGVRDPELRERTSKAIIRFRDVYDSQGSGRAEPVAGEQTGQLFQTRISGYDKTQVDERIGALEAALRDARARVEELDSRAMKLAGEVAEAHRQLREVERPSYSGLGARIEQLLRLAEEQASDVIAAATKDADDSLAQARVEAAQARAAAQNEAGELTASAQRESA